MKAIYTRTIGVYDDKLGEAMEISKGLAEVRKKHYPDHEVYFSFQIGGNPRTVRETLKIVRPDIFTNGGDQNNNTIPEIDVCNDIGIELVDGLGKKIQSSSWLIKGDTQV